ncbi:MAG TPA: PPC domain-containing DNA-binding protein [Candidatus Nanoarchaeia archaeon]|nr:PPC domain-containing DNA-binding protein [Candidatus Nanoarchaeia archaeon]
MKFKKSGNTFIISIGRGEKIIETLKEFCTSQKIKCGYFSGLGALDEAELAHYTVESRKYTSKLFKKPLEIISLNGNITNMGNKPYLHCHISLSDNKMNLIAGHLKEGKISAACEIFLVKLNANIGRTYNDSIGLNLMDFKKK